MTGLCHGVPQHDAFVNIWILHSGFLLSDITQLKQLRCIECRTTV